jgi:AraC family transcriptional regulator of arabinose operon
VRAYQTELLMRKAVDLMRQTTLNISEISELLRFPNPYYFSKVFKKANGISPLAYMQRIYKK